MEMESKTPMSTNERQKKWLKNPENQQKRNYNRAKRRAETEPNVLYSTFVKYGLDLDKINTVRKQNQLNPITVPEPPSPMNTAALALALEYKRRADEAIEEAGIIEQRAEDQVESTQDALRDMAKRQNVPQLIGPDLSFDQLRSYYKYWFEPFDEYGNTQVDPEYDGSEREYRFQHYPHGTLKESNFKEYLGLQGFKLPSGRTSQQMGEVWNILVKMNCKTRSENIMPCLKQRNTDGTLTLISLLTGGLQMKSGKSYDKKSITKFLQAMVWLFETFPFVKPGFLTILEYNNTYKEIREVYLQYAAEGHGTENIPNVEPFSELLKRVVETYGINSEQSLFMHLFQVIPVRDNFGRLRILRNKPTEEELRKLTREKNENWLYVPTRGTIIMYLANYKTQNLYNTQVIEFKKPSVTEGMTSKFATELGAQFVQVSKLIIAHIKENKSEYLFTEYPSQKLAKDLITPMLKGINATGSAKGLGINYLRHSFVTEFFKGKVNDATNVTRSKRMLHSPVMHEKYVYELKIDKEIKLDAIEID